MTNSKKQNKTSTQSKSSIKSLNINEICEPDHSVRFTIDESSLYELQENIRTNGLLQPIVVRTKNGNDTYEIIAGHRRFLACKKIGLSTIEAKIIETDEIGVAVLKASENLARVNLSAVEEGRIYSELSTKHSMAYADIAEKFGKSKNIIIDRIQLLKLPDFVLTAIHDKKISQSVGLTLLGFEDPRALKYYFNYAMESGANVTTMRGWVADYKRDALSQAGDGEETLPPTMSHQSSQKVYFTCDMCTKPGDIEKATYLRICETCMEEKPVT